MEKSSSRRQSLLIRSIDSQINKTYEGTLEKHFENSKERKRGNMIPMQNLYEFEHPKKTAKRTDKPNKLASCNEHTVKIDVHEQLLGDNTYIENCGKKTVIPFQKIGNDECDVHLKERKSFSGHLIDECNLWHSQPKLLVMLCKFQTIIICFCNK